MQALIHGCNWQEMNTRATELILGLVDVAKNGPLEEGVRTCTYIKVVGMEGCRN